MVLITLTTIVAATTYIEITESPDAEPVDEAEDFQNLHLAGSIQESHLKGDLGIDAIDVMAGTEGMIVLTNESWYSADSAKVDRLARYAMQSVPIISLDGPRLFNENSQFGSVAYSDDSDLCGYYHDSSANVIYCYSVCSDDQAEAMQRIKDWAIRMGSEFTAEVSNADNLREVICEKDMKCGSDGWFSISTKYGLRSHDATGYDYWAVEYYMESVPSSGVQTSSMKIYDDFSCTFMDAQLLRHGPNTTTGTESSSLDISIDVSGPSVSVGIQYAIPDVTVINNSSLATDVFSITHRFSRDTMAACNTYFCKPAAIIKCEFGDSEIAYSPIDEYSITFDHRELVSKEYVWKSTTYDLRILPILYSDR